MDLDEMIKYIIWVVLFAVVLVGLYFLFKRLGIV